MKAGDPWIAASSSRLPPQRTRVTRMGSPPVTSTQFAASGRSAIADACASTSLPRGVPAATTAVGSTFSVSSTSARAIAAGAKLENASPSATWTVSTPSSATSRPAANAWIGSPSVPAKATARWATSPGSST